MFSIVSECLERLRRRYAEPHRAFHGQAHVDALLTGLAREGHHSVNRASTELAIWYHDAIYDPGATDNEARSADLLVADMHRLACPSIVGAAESMIRATADHDLPPDVPKSLRDDMAIFLDLDMSVIGAEPADYDVYEAGIAAEYVPVHGLDDYRAGRAAFLRGMLSRERLFHTERFHHRLDATARVNLRRGLRGLAL